MKQSKFYQKIFDNRKQLALLFVLLLLFVFFNEVKALIVVSLLFAFGALGQIYKRFLRFTSAVEFVTFGTVIVAVAYGPISAALFALASSFAAEVISGNIDAFMLIYLPVRVLSGIFAAFVPGSSIVIIGIMTSVFINALSQPFYLIQADAEIRVKGLTYLVLNITFNILLFKIMANPILNLMSIELI